MIKQFIIIIIISHSITKVCFFSGIIHDISTFDHMPLDNILTWQFSFTGETQRANLLQNTLTFEENYLICLTQSAETSY